MVSTNIVILQLLSDKDDSGRVLSSSVIKALDYQLQEEEKNYF